MEGGVRGWASWKVRRCSLCALTHSLPVLAALPAPVSVSQPLASASQCIRVPLEIAISQLHHLLFSIRSVPDSPDRTSASLRRERIRPPALHSMIGGKINDDSRSPALDLGETRQSAPPPL
ncbi:hypothetical protein IWX49DRAFT_261691 [Phyllosticta citricarpa]|uniref:Uncharacterized protein n=1 Tax=Phyllosticta citricarpa TaxID=55181 RepID=A0ABR1LKE7_9PEZI